MKAELDSQGVYIDMTNETGAIIAGGTLVRIGGRVGIVAESVGIAAKHAPLFAGNCRGRNAAVIGNAGDNLYWDDNGDPVDGDAGTGAFTTDATAADYWVGTLNQALAATDTDCYFSLNVPNPDLPAWSNRAHVKTAVDLTYVAATHSGKVIHVTADAKTLTLPVGVVGMEVIVVNDVADAGALVTVDLNGNETIQGNLTIAATKTALLTKTTSKRGDFLHLVCTTAAGIWRCVEKRGTWVTST